ncbi:hypothetical protein ACH43Y_14070 [Streptomyces rubiginosohelvolus]|uniref:hypothetical protein n=1 Tax=Streptomyces TaxID=1883 RepID=UPI000B5CF153|nr:hypothetical protein [Streptomyces sp. SS07]
MAAVTPEEEFRFFAQIIGDAQRTILCEPHRVAEIQDVVNRQGMAGIVTVKASRVCPEGKLLVLDEQAMEASCRQAVSRPIRLHP